MRSACKEQVNLELAGSKPKALHRPWEDLNWRVLRAGTPSLVGCISVAAACNEAAMFSSSSSLVSVEESVSAYHLTNYRKGRLFNEWRRKKGRPLPHDLVVASASLR